MPTYPTPATETTWNGFPLPEADGTQIALGWTFS